MKQINYPLFHYFLPQTKYKNMTFVWTEMSFLSMWFETAHEARKANFRALVNEGRFEILTGGWVSDFCCIAS